MLGDQELLTVIEKFSEAATDSEQWSQALRQLAALTRSSHAQLIGIGGPDTIQFNIISDLPPSLTEEFIQIDGSNPLVNPRIAASNLAGKFNGRAPHSILVAAKHEAARAASTCHSTSPTMHPPTSITAGSYPTASAKPPPPFAPVLLASEAANN